MAVDDVYTKLLLHMEGTDNGTIFTDESGSVITRVDSTCTKTGIKKFGISAGYFDGAGDYLTVPSLASLYFGTGAFTVDFWEYTTTARSDCLFSYGGSNGNFAVYHRADNKFLLYHGAYAYSINTYAKNMWHHVAIVGNGLPDGSRNVKVYIDGNLEITLVKNYSWSSQIYIGANQSATSENLLGYLDEIRVSVGVQRWTDNFTPPQAEYGPDFKLSGNAVFGPYILPEMLVAPASSTIAWSEDIPAGTSLTLKAAIVSTTPIESDYLDILNGGVIPGLSLDSSGKNLYIKAYLATTDVTKTPKLLTSPQYVITEAPDLKAVQLDLSELGRIKAPIGNIVDVGFTGLLSGLGGSNVDAFSLPFSPTDIVPYFNPNDAEHLSVAVAPTIAVTEVTYLYAQEGAEYLTAQVAGISIVATLIGSIPL